MNALFSQLVRSDIGLALSEVTESSAVFTVRTKSGGPKLIFGILFGIPGVLLLYSALTTGGLMTLIAAIIFCPILFGLAALFGASISEKRFDKTSGTFTSSLLVFGYSTSETLPLPTTGRLVIKSENRGSAKGAPGSTLRYSVLLENCPGAGFALSKDYGTLRAFAERLSQFLALPIEDTVTEMNR
ncbi:MAG: hypothetical protein Q8O53_03495 [Candidatus Moranbacteria bacterium]|nr:hypothetical protein [Candidatus Moranbacteria bacterium]